MSKKADQDECKDFALASLSERQNFFMWCETIAVKLVCSVMDHRWSQYAVRTKEWHMRW